MSLVRVWLRLVRRWISSEMSAAESSCAKRSSSILVSSSAIGCSNSRKVVFTGGRFYPHSAYQYSTGTGSRERQRYQVATDRQGRQVSPSLRMVLRDSLRPLK